MNNISKIKQSNLFARVHGTTRSTEMNPPNILNLETNFNLELEKISQWLYAISEHWKKQLCVISFSAMKNSS